MSVFSSAIMLAVLLGVLVWVLAGFYDTPALEPAEVFAELESMIPTMMKRSA